MVGSHSECHTEREHFTLLNNLQLLDFRLPLRYFQTLNRAIIKWHYLLQRGMDKRWGIKIFYLRFLLCTDIAPHEIRLNQVITVMGSEGPGVFHLKYKYKRTMY